MHRSPATLLAALAAVACAAPLHAQKPGTSESIQSLLGDSTQFREAIAAFQRAVRAHDAAGVAALVS